MNEKLLAELREWAKDCTIDYPDGDKQRCHGLKEFDEILSRHDHKHEQEDGLMGGKCCPNYNECPVPCRDYDPRCSMIPTPKPQAEALAELADRKGFSEVIIQMGGKAHLGADWLLLFRGYNPQKSIVAPTYAEAEALARTFLTGLDDVTGKGGRV